MNVSTSAWLRLNRSLSLAASWADSTFSEARDQLQSSFRRVVASPRTKESLEIEDLTERVATRLAETSTALARRLRRDRRILSITLEQVWGVAFQAYDAVAYASYELGASWAEGHQSPARPLVWSTLLDLHSRACLVASEIAALHRTGFPAGATARWRSLHELAVIALVLQGADEEITERYRDREAIEHHEDAKEYQSHASALGYSPLSDDELRLLSERHDAVVAKWGKAIKAPNGWALPLAPGFGSVGVGKLEEIAGVEHLAPFYLLGNHAVHGGPRASSLQRVEINGVQYRTPGATVFGDIAETAHGALISLHQVNCALLSERCRTDDLNSQVVITAGAIGELVERAGPVFGRAADVARSKGWFSHRP